MNVHVAQLYIPHKKVVQITLLIFCMLLAGYVFLVNQTVRQVVERRELEVANSQLGTNVSQLEFTYIDAKNTITKEKAFAKGFLEAAKVTYISRVPDTRVVTLNR